MALGSEADLLAVVVDVKRDEAAVPEVVAVAGAD
jgi:hypothetical protein